MIKDLQTDEKEQLIVTLALIQKALQDLAEKVDTHQKTLFGNGDPQHCVVWCLKELTESIKSVEKKADEIAAFHTKIMQEGFYKQESNFQSKETDLSWSQVLKKILIKAPWVIAVIASVALINKPAIELLSAFIKLLTGK